MTESNIALKKVIFWGSPDFSLPSLHACFENSELVAVVSQPDRPKGRGHETSPTPVKAWALANAIPAFSPKSLRKIDAEGEALMTFLRAHPVDYFVVVAYGNILPDAVLQIPTLAPVNVHASLLPRWRGAAPIQRAVEAGDTETGVCLQRMVTELDAGDILLERRLALTESDNSKTLFSKLSHLGGELLRDFLARDFRAIVARPQNSADVTLAPKITKSEAAWHPTWSPAEFHNRVRAFVAWPTVRVAFRKDRAVVEIKVLATRLSVMNASRAWGIESGQALLECRGGSVEILQAQLPGKGPASGAQIFAKLESDGFTLEGES